MPMDQNFASAVSHLVGENYVERASNACTSLEKLFTELVTHRKIPEHGFTDMRIEFLLSKFANMDSNNFIGSCGAGEREGRVFSSLVKHRHFNLTHGIGRSGDVAAVQPKAIGSSTMVKIVNRLALHAIHLSGITSTSNAVVIPVATGMALLLSFLSLSKKSSSRPKYIIWCRIDQKSCFKSILSAGFEPIIVEGLIVGDAIQTNLPELERLLSSMDKNEILCVFTTTSCFSPRIPDDVESVAKLCKKHDVAHIINNAYGLQSKKSCHLIELANRQGRVDVFVQSTDKNFMVPVGGSIIASKDAEMVEFISKMYPGRASATPSIDLLITFLSMGVTGYKKLLNQRTETYEYLRTKIQEFAEKHGERLLDTKHNNISLAITLTSFEKLSDAELSKKKTLLTEIGSKLFSRQVSGARVVQVGTEPMEIGGISFSNWGAHSSKYPVSYLNVAAAIGMKNEEVDALIKRLTSVFKKL